MLTTARLRSSVGCLLLLVLMTVAVEAQNLNPPYLSQMPPVERVKAEIKGQDPMERAARQMGAFWQLRKVIYDLAYAQRRTDRQHTPDETRLANEYYAAYYYASQPYEHVEKTLSHPDRSKWYKLHAFYEHDSGFLDELLGRFFSPEFRAGYYRAVGKQPPRAQPSAADNRPQPSAPAGTGAAAYYEQGDKYLEAKDYAKAIAAYKKAIALKPSSAALNGLGTAYFRLKQYSEAVAAYKEAIRLKPDNAFANFNLGNAYGDLKQHENAAGAFREALRIKPDYADASFFLGGTYYALRQYPEALTALQQSLRLKLSDDWVPSAHLLLGLVYVRTGKKQEALRVYKTLQTIDKELAQELFDEIDNPTVSSQPSAPAATGPEAYVAEGDRYTKAKDYARAIEAYKKAVALNPALLGELVDGTFESGLSYSDSDQHQVALAEFKLALALMQEEPRVRSAPSYKPPQFDLVTLHLAVGDSHRALKQYPEALEAFRNALALEALPSAYRAMGATYNDMKQYDKAIPALREALRLKPDDFASSEHQGLAHYALRQYPEAVAVLRQAVRLKPDRAPAHYGLGLSYLRMGRKDEALQVYRRLLSIDKATAQQLYAAINKSK